MHREPLPGGPILWFGPFLILGAVALVLYLEWDELPERIVVHWGFSGPDRWAPKSWRSVFLVLIIGAWAQVLLFATGLGIARSARSPADGDGRRGTQRSLNLQLLCAVAYVTAFIIANIALTPAVGDRVNLPINMWILLAALAIVIGGTVLQVVRHAGEPDEDADAPPQEGWRWGVFYYNPQDPAVMVPKRTGLGYTLNFANRAAWIFACLTIVLLMLVLLAP